MPKAALILLLALAALVTIANEAAADNTGACRFTGTVKLDGANVPDGTVIKAFIGDDVYTTTTPTGYGPSTYSVEVRPPDGEGYAEGTQVRFTIDGYAADQTGSFQGGENIRWDLTAKRPPASPTPASSSSPGASLVALIAVVFITQVSAVGGVAYIAVTDWAR
jgi:hypothetical protein